MYSLNDIFQQLQFHLNYILQYFPYVLFQFFMMFLLRTVLLSMFLRSGIHKQEGLQRYAFSFLMLMLVASLLASTYLLVSFEVVFYLGNDFVFLAGIFLGGRKGFPLLIVNWLFMFCFTLMAVSDWMRGIYFLLDTTIYFLVGWFASEMYYCQQGECTWNEIIFMTINKMMACIISAACWLVMMRDSWYVGFNILLFRLVILPLSSLPLFFLFLFFMRQDAGRFWVASARRV